MEYGIKKVWNSNLFVNHFNLKLFEFLFYFDFGFAIRIPTSSGKDIVKGKFGTLRYMAPETRTGEGYSYPIDVYAYAILFWQIITTHVPFEEDILTSNLFAPTDNLSDDTRPNLKYVESKELSALLQSRWKTHPEERLTLDELGPTLQCIGRQICLSYEEDEKKKKESVSKTVLDYMVTQYQKNAILTGAHFDAWVKSVLYFFRN